MISSNTRASRSRYSSPAAQGAQTPTPAPAPALAPWSSPLQLSKNSGNEGSKSFMERWLEPSLQSKPSFEEAGLVRHGVLENMAPLGSLPKAKKNGGDNGGSGIRKITLKASAAAKAARQAKAAAAAGAAGAANDSGTDTSEPVSRRMASAPPPGRRSGLSKGAAGGDDDEDGDYTPKGSSRRRNARRSSIPNGKPLDIKAEQEAPSTESRSRSRSRRRSPSVSRSLVAAAQQMGTEDKATTEKVIEVAIEEALTHYRYPTAWALRTLYEEKAGDETFERMITDIFSQSADEETLSEFARQLEEKKREGKRDNQSDYYSAPPSINGRLNQREARQSPYGASEDQPDETDQELLGAEAGVKENLAGGSEAGKSGKYSKSTGTRGGDETRAAKKAKTSHTDGDAPSKPAVAPEATATSTVGISNGTIDAAAGATATATTGSTSVANTAGGAAQDAGDGDNGQTPSRKRRRRDSGSSDSSLSSAMSLPSPEVRRTSLSPSLRRAATPAGTASSSAGASRNKPQREPKTATSKPRPITTTTARGKSAASSTSASASEPNSPTASLTNNTTKHHRSAHDSMPGRLAAASESASASASDLFPNLPGRTAGKGAKPAKASKASKESPDTADSPMQEADIEIIFNRRRDAQRITNGYTAAESSVRGPRQRRDATPVRKTRKTRQSLATPYTTRTTRSATKRPHDDIDSTVSPVALSFRDDDGSTTAGSRAVTPSAQKPGKKAKGLRVKSSPVKKTGGPAAGMPKLVSDASSSFGAGTPKDQASDNDEYCSACGNAGDVLCCDGCPRSFHFECVDLDQSEDLPDEWFCNECIVRRFPSRVPIHKGAFASALNNLEKSIPRAFSLPKRVQNRFEGVKAGADGDYDEVNTTKNPKKRTAGYDELPDLYKQREDNQPVLCHTCQKSATDVRAIIPCSVCPFHWHLDCLDPPLAVPPVLKTWRCPAHADETLSEAPGLAPAHKFRRVKNAPTITPIFTRGMKNNGHIEVDWSDEPEPFKDAGWPDPLSFGRTYKVSANGLVLDFIEQLRQQGAGYGTRQEEQKVVPYPPAAAQRTDSPGPLLGSTLGRQVDEMQASLNLVGLKASKSEGIDQLTSALLSSVDENVLALMARSNADNIAAGHLTDDDKIGLRAMMVQMDAMSARIRHVLGEDKHISSMPTPDAGATSPPSEHDHVLPKKEEEPHTRIAEPTPPLTVDHADGSMELD